MSVNPVSHNSAGASLFVPVNLKPDETRTIRVYIAWYVPHSDIYVGTPPVKKKAVCSSTCTPGSSCCSSEITSQFYEPWYSGKFKDVKELSDFWRINYDQLKNKTELFTKAFYSSDLPAEVMEAVAANLTILKSPTVLRQTDGRLWGWEGCGDNEGCCHGSCTHVWNYAQAISHLFPSLERTLRETEFRVSQNDQGHQTFRSSLPIARTSS